MAWLILPGAVLLAALVPALWLVASLRWLQRETRRDRYFARPLAGRRALRRRIERRARWVVPLFRVLARIHRFSPPSFEYRGVVAPRMNCPPRVFAAATRYAPDARDVFVATQMKCGTTWTQQIVYETLLHGRGDLGDAGHRHMYALSPWLESTGAVAMEDAPRLGQRGRRIVKTHLPARLCPWAPEARFVYVLRHPLACFASCVDFVRFVGGPMAPSLPEFVDWFCSDRMWWSAWPEHADGWWRRAQEHENVLFLHYEEMLDDLGGAVDRVAAHLDVALAPDERAAVVAKSGYEYMKAHEELFEMSPPNYFSVAGGSFFVRGTSERPDDVGPAERERILRFCRERLEGSPYPLARFYPDVASA